jgi:uncharacterized protein with HEPN domain
MSRDLDRLLDSIDHVMEICTETGAFIEGMTAEGFRADRLRQRAVSMDLVIIGEIAADILKRNPDFAADHPEIGWTVLVDLRNHIQRDHSSVDPAALWAAAIGAVPQLLSQLRALRHFNAQGE